MRILIALLLLLPLRLFGAVGDINSFAIETNGWVVRIEANLGTNCWFYNGLGTNNSLTVSNSLTVTLDSMGFNDDGTGLIQQRTVYGTRLLRRPYPDQSINDCLTNDAASLVTLRVALSDYIYSRDSNVTATIRASSIIDTNTSDESTLATAVAVTNLSVQPYPSVIGNWSWRGFRVIDEEYMTLRAVAFHKSAREGRPVRSAMFWVTDSGANSFTNWVTKLVIDRSMNDANPIPEYIARFATNSLAAGHVVCNVRFYPWIGDTALDSSATGFLEPTPQLCPLTNAVNISRVRAIVSNIGNDTGSVAYDEAAWAADQSPSNFLTIGKAMTAIYNTNAGAYSRAGWGGGIIYLMDGAYGWFGSAVNLINGPDMELLIQPYPGQTSCVITNYAVDRMATTYKDLYRMKNLFITGTTYIPQLFYQTWFEGCTITNNTSSLWIDGDATQPSTIIITQCQITNVPGALNTSVNDNTASSLIRGNRLGTNLGATVRPYVALGNTRSHEGLSSAYNLVSDWTNQPTPRNFQSIIAYNKWYNSESTLLSIPNAYSLTNGAAVIQNVFESGVSNTQAGYMVGKDNPSVHTTNLLVWYNLFLSTRMLRCYNEVGTAPAWSVDNSWVGNLFDLVGHKDDTYGSGNGNRIGGWPIMYGVSCVGNYFGAQTNVAPPGFTTTFVGINSHEETAMRPVDYWRTTSRGGWDGLVTNAPGGNYRLLSDSPIHNRVLKRDDWLIPFDLEGRDGGRSDPPGAYISGNVIKGSMF